MTTYDTHVDDLYQAQCDLDEQADREALHTRLRRREERSSPYVVRARIARVTMLIDAELQDLRLLADSVLHITTLRRATDLMHRRNRVAAYRNRLMCEWGCAR